MLCINVTLFKKLCAVATCMKEGVAFYHAETNILRFVAGVRHCVAGVMLIKCFSSTDPGFSTEGIGYCSGTSVSNAIGIEGDWLAGKARKHGRWMVDNW